MEPGSRDPQFDSFIGGSQSVPSSITLSDFLKHRMEEIVTLTETIKESPFRGQTFQRLPIHMRRRQMSHYVKRLPRKLQGPYLMSLKDGLPPPTKCPSRKYRRRPGNLLLEYNRRQQKNVWLETHIWHAKRFHMTKKWNYKLPEKPVNKSFRACYRAISEHCLLTDISYWNCVELNGPKEKLLEGLNKCVSHECGLTFAAKMYINGSREGAVDLFHSNSYPYQVIGNVKFMWNPTSDNNFSKIWIWVHPQIHEEVIECFKFVFDLSSENLNFINKEINEEKVDTEDKNKKRRKREKKKDKKSMRKIEQIKLMPKNIPFIRTPKFYNSDRSITMVLLKDTLNRFQLTGPQSHPIITQAFHSITVLSNETKNSEIEVKLKSRKRKLGEDIEIITDESKTEDSEEVLVEVEKKKNWWEVYYNNEVNAKCCIVQNDFYKKLSNCSKPTDVPSGIVLSLIISDPRLTIPAVRKKAVPKSQEPCQVPSDMIDFKLCMSPIWNSEIRDEVSVNKLTTHEINMARSKKIVPGSDVKEIIPDNKQSRIPILLVQRPGRSDCKSGKLGLGSGWDIISPAGFGMPIWLSLIFRGARTGGLRESKMIQLESNSLGHCLQPDSFAGDIEAKETFQELKSRYFKLPPNKRPNFRKLGVLSPFYCPWKMLVRDWIMRCKPEIDKLDVENQRFWVLRDRDVLRQLSAIVGNSERNREVVKSLLENRLDCLVPILIECTDKGKPKELAMICLPDRQDLENLKNTKLGPKEPVQMDDNEKLRKVKKMEHLKLLKSLRRKRKKDRMKLKEYFEESLPGKLKRKDIYKSDSASAKTCSDTYNAEMEKLWVPELKESDSIIDSCSKLIIGFIKNGDFCFAKSLGAGMGYVTFPGLVELLNICEGNKKVIVLVRNTNHVQYRYCKLKILAE